MPLDWLLEVYSLISFLSFYNQFHSDFLIALKKHKELVNDQDQDQELVQKDLDENLALDQDLDLELTMLRFLIILNMECACNPNA